MTAVFLDTVGIIALLDEDDQWHTMAARAYAELSSARGRLVTTDAVLLECGNAVARRPYRKDIDDLRQKLAIRGDLIEIEDSDITSGWAAFRRGAPGDAGIVDHLSFVVMRRLGLTQVFTNDRHFGAAGFEVLF